MDIKVYLLEFVLMTENGVVNHATMHEAVSDALIMAASPALCKFVIAKRGYTLVDKAAFKRTTEYKRNRLANRLMSELSEVVYH